MNVLVDTSVWVDFLRHPSDPAGRALDQLLERRQVLMCGPVAAELLAGTTPAQQGELWSVLSGLPWAELERDAWRVMGEIAWMLRRDGITVGLTDLSIAVAALAADASVWTRDGAFEHLRAAAGLELYEP